MTAGRPPRLRRPRVRRSPVSRSPRIRRPRVRRSPEEVAALQRAKAVLDRLGFYPQDVRIDRVRILHVPWLFRAPWFRRFTGYEMGPLILLKHPLAETPHELIVHELCHVWQDQDHRLRMWWSYIARGYAENAHEVEARRAAAAVHSWSST